MAEILIGTSGWVYKSWAERFYPKDLAQKHDLEYYSHQFPTVEINSSYYRLPSEQAYDSWKEQVPSDFVFSVKASRFLTHMKKLKDPADPWERIMKGAVHLESKLGPILLQFPQMWTKNIERLEEFFESIDKSKRRNVQLVFELRNESWHTKDVLRLLERNDAAWCIADSFKFDRFDDVTTDFTYIRYHGREADKPSNYTDAELKREATKIKRFARRGIEVFAYFNNDAEGHAVRNAQKLTQLVA
ncbi:MAG TPA: DUF72 domain-containing protein [Chroococcales cyanobacterium]